MKETTDPAVRRRLAALALSAVVLSAEGAATGAAAQTGSLHTRLLTFAEASVADLGIQIRGPKDAGVATVVWLEFGADGSSLPLPTPAVAGIGLTLTKLGVAGSLTFSASTAVSDATTFPGKVVTYQPNTANPRLISVVILHSAGLGAADTENWKLVLANLPAGGQPPARAIAYVDEGGFVSLTPLAPSLGGLVVRADIDAVETATQIAFTATVTGEVPGKSYDYRWLGEDDAGIGTTDAADTKTMVFTRPPTLPCGTSAVTFRFEVTDGGNLITTNRRTVNLYGEPCRASLLPGLEFDELQAVPFTAWCADCPRPEPCPTCPPEWRAPAAADQSRVAVLFSPVDGQGRPLGPGHPGDIAFRVSGAAAVGGIHDTGTGAYLQVVEHPRGDAARIEISARGVSTGEIVVGGDTSGRARLYRNLGVAAMVALVLSLAANGWLVWRRRH
jgi:hypothetical protein